MTLLVAETKNLPKKTKAERRANDQIFVLCASHCLREQQRGKMNSREIYWYGMVCEFGFDSGAKN